MRPRRICLVLCLPLAVLTSPGIASATPPVGVCPSDYTLMTRSDVSQLPDADLALAAFDAVDANGDSRVCYRPYRNGPHNGHYGNFIDDTAAPHQR
ncbi:MAG TPA: hypothetical protein VI452_18210 [Marmoricola sp.]|jgi:hypothetical protein